MSSLAIPTADAQRRAGDAAGGDPRLERLLTRADALAARERTVAAIRLYRLAAERVPEDPRAPIALAEALLPASPEAAEAIAPGEDLRRAAADVRERLSVVVIPGDTTVPEFRARTAQVRRIGPWALALTGDHRGAIEGAALAAGRLDDIAASILRRLGALAIRRHDLVAADHALTAARRADPVDVGLVTDLAAIRLARGHATEAVGLLQEARRRRPADSAIVQDLAGALLAAGRAEDALAIFAAVAGEHPNDSRAHLDLARAALEAGHPERGIQAARRALRAAEERDPEPALVLATAHLAAGDSAGARRAFEEALRRAPDDPRARRGLSALEVPRRVAAP